jgi:hypothetical protein
MSSSQFSVYIPRIFTNIPNSKIISTFKNLDLGKVKNMDIIYRTGTDGTTYKMAFIHFSTWYSNSAAINLRKRIEDPTIEAKLVYDDPWYWLVLPNRSSTSRQHRTNAHNINLSDCVNRINSMSEKLNDVYNEMFMKTQTISTTEYDVDSFEDIESGDSAYSSISELNTHLPNKYAKIHPNNSYYDEQMSVSSDGFNDLEVGGSSDSYAILVPDTKNDLRKWITENVCGNA